MTTRREQILTALATALSSTSGVSGRAYRSRVEPIARNESPALIVEPVSDSPVQPDTIGRLTWQLTVRVTVFVRSATPDSSADSIVQSLYSKVMADPTLGGYALDIMPGQVNFELIEADMAAGIVTSEFVVMYQTSFDDISTI